jgi:hypothetical protein
MGTLRTTRSLTKNLTLTAIFADVGKTMKTIALSTITRRLTAVALVAVALAANAFATDNRAPLVPTDIKVEAGNRVHFHAYAAGYQVYVATETTGGLKWVLKAPDAVLFDNDGNVVGIHYAGPTWETSSGSWVKGARVNGITVDASAIPWLLLKATDSNGPGVLNGTTFIQRVNTVGGIAPASASGAQIGDELRVAYTAEYYFFRAVN